jgi:hypothetical protein
MFLEQLAEGDLFDAADGASVVVVLLVFELIAVTLIFSAFNTTIVAHVDVRAEGALCLPLRRMAICVTDSQTLSVASTTNQSRTRFGLRKNSDISKTPATGKSHVGSERS